MKNDLAQLIDAESNAASLFDEIQNRNLIIAGKSEKIINTEIFNLALNFSELKNIGINELFDLEKTPYFLIRKTHPI